MDASDEAAQVDWVLQQVRGSLIVRLDLITGSEPGYSTGDEAIRAEMLCHFWDEEGSALGRLTYSVPSGVKRDKGIVAFGASTDEAAWPFFVSHAIASWEQDWHKQTMNVCRRVRWNPLYGRNLAGSLPVGNPLVLQALSRIEGAVEQFVPDARLGFDETSVIHKLRTHLANVRRSGNRELGHLLSGY